VLATEMQEVSTHIRRVPRISQGVGRPGSAKEVSNLT
jgi:hypothetical protein